MLNAIKKLTKSQPDAVKVLYSPSTIKSRVQRLGRQITNDYKGEQLNVIGVLKGSSIFYADLLREIDLPLKTDFVKVSSYGNNTSTSGVATLKSDIDIQVEDQHILLVEDIIDSGITAKFLIKHFHSKKTRSVKICTLLYKEQSSQSFAPDYVGFIIPDEFVVGYGLDYAEYYRNLPYVGILDTQRLHNLI